MSSTAHLLRRWTPILLLFPLMLALSGCLLPPQVVIEAQEATATALAATPVEPIMAVAPAPRARDADCSLRRWLGTGRRHLSQAGVH
ncbi:MAG: hypothetical protein R3A44_30675 [Caldilineaceae bacterium]